MVRNVREAGQRLLGRNAVRMLELVRRRIGKVRLVATRAGDMPDLIAFKDETLYGVGHGSI